MRQDVFACPSPNECRKDCRFFNERNCQCLQDLAIKYGEEGAKWADENPKSRFNISDSDSLFLHLQTIINNAEHMTTGNMAHNRASILLMARDAMRVFKHIPKVNPEDKEKYIISKELFDLITDWFQWDVDMCEKITSGNVSHNIATIKAHARNCKSFIEEYCKIVED